MELTEVGELGDCCSQMLNIIETYCIPPIVDLILIYYYINIYLKILNKIICKLSNKNK